MRQAVILAGGRGQRLLPHTADRPKAMVEVGGVPILRHQLDWFARSGVRHAVISAGNFAEVIVEYVAGNDLMLDVNVVIEDRPLGRGGGLRLASAALRCPDEPWFSVYGDIWTEFSLPAMAEYHRRHGALATVALTRLRTNAGVYVFGPEVATLLPEQGDHQDSTLPQLAVQGQLIGYPLECDWYAINTPQDLAEVTGKLAG